MNGILMSLLGVEIALTVIAAGLFLWRGVLDMKEDDQLILNDSEEHLARDQVLIRSRVSTLSRYIKVVGVAWSVLAVAIFGVWLVDGLALI